MGASKNNKNQEKKILVADPDLYYYECYFYEFEHIFKQEVWFCL